MPATDKSCVIAVVVGVTLSVACSRSPEEQLHRAAQRGRVEEVERLLASGVPVNATDGWSSTALMYAASHCQLEVVKVLVANGGDIDEHLGRRMGRTPTMWAAQAGCADVVLWLKQAGADLSLTDQEGNTAADLARANGHTAVAVLVGIGK